MKMTKSEIDLLLQERGVAKKRNLEIYRARKAGETFVALAKRYGLTENAVSTICDQEQFREQDPGTAALCEDLGGFQRAAWLWARGYEIIPPGNHGRRR